MIKLGKPLSAVAAIILVNSLAFTAIADDDAIAVTQVTENIYMLSGRGGNLGALIGDDGTFLIDDQYAAEAPKILEALASIGGDSPEFLINTHYHGDHTGGNEILGEAGALIMAHENVRARLADGYELKAFGMNVDPAPTAALPVVTYASDVTVHLNGDVAHIIHIANAHTDGDSIVVFEKANVIHTGDLMFNGFFPFIDISHGGSVKGMARALRQIAAMADEQTKIIPGHGPLAAKSDALAAADMLDTAYERLSELRSQGLSAEQAIAQNPLADLDKDWGGVIFSAEKWIGVVYDGLD